MGYGLVVTHWNVNLEVMGHIQAMFIAFYNLHTYIYI